MIEAVATDQSVFNGDAMQLTSDVARKLIPIANNFVVVLVLDVILLRVAKEKRAAWKLRCEIHKF